MSSAEIVLTPGEAAKQLGVSPSGLRRLAVEYGKVFGELPKDASGTSRMWTGEAVARLKAARALMAAGGARSITAALEASERGAQAPLEAFGSRDETRILEALGLVVEKLGELERSNKALRREVAELKALPDARQEVAIQDADGVLVRLARRLERLLWRRP